MRRGGLTLRELRILRSGSDETRVPLSGPRPHDVPVAALLRAILDGAAVPLVDGAGHLLLEIEAAGERFHVIRGATPRLVRLAPEGEEILAEGDEIVTAFVARIAGTSEPLGRRVVARAGDVATWLRDELHGGAHGSLHSAVVRELEAAAAALGGRMRDLLHRAHGLLHEASEELVPNRAEPLTPEALASLREDLAAALGSASSRLARVEESVAVAGSLLTKLKERQARIEEYMRAEKLGRKLEKQKALMDGQRRKLQRAQAASGLARPGSGGATGPSPERRARERAEAEVEAARATLSAARAALAVEEARSAEREAVAEWIARLDEMAGALDRLDGARRVVARAEARIAELERVERSAGDEIAAAQASLERTRRALLAVDASPEEAARAHEEAASAARLFGDVRRLAQVRDELRDRAREVQLAKIAAERAEEELAHAQREVEWNRESPHPRDVAELPSLPELVSRRDRLVLAIDEASASLLATREELRRRTTELGTRAYLSPELLEAEAREKAEAAGRFGSAGLDRAELEARIAADERRLREAGAAREAAAAEIGGLSLQRLEARERIAEIEGAVPSHLRSRDALREATAEARREHAVRQDAWDEAWGRARAAETSARDAEDALRRARAAEESASRRLVDLGGDLSALRAAGFASWDDVEEARLDEAALAALRDEIAEHEALERMVEEGTRHGRDEMLLPRTDPAQAELLHALLSHAREIGRSRHDRSARDLATIDRWLDALDEIAAELEHVEEAAGLTGGAERSGRFEERAREALARRVLARAEGRLASWQRPWSLRWEGAAGEPRRLVVVDAETGAIVDAAALADGGRLALALAVELALAGEPIDLACLVVEGAESLPEGDAGVRLILG